MYTVYTKQKGLTPALKTYLGHNYVYSWRQSQFLNLNNNVFTSE